MGAWTVWKHAQHSHVNQPANVTTEKDRGGEQGDTQGPLEACADLAVQAREVRSIVHAKQCNGALPWRTESEGAKAGARTT
eukprot:10647747-Lingulodinium_polyedra.AAC.1